MVSAEREGTRRRSLATLIRDSESGQRIARSGGSDQALEADSAGYEKHPPASLGRGVGSHTYEQQELGGRRDENWARWYADYALEHGLEDALGTTLSSDDLAKVLTRATADHDAQGAETEWSEFAAERVARHSRLG